MCRQFCHQVVSSTIIEKIFLEGMKMDTGFDEKKIAVEKYYKWINKSLSSPKEVQKTL